MQHHTTDDRRSLQDGQTPFVLQPYVYIVTADQSIAQRLETFRLLHQSVQAGLPPDTTTVVSLQYAAPAAGLAPPSALDIVLTGVFVATVGVMVCGLWALLR